MNRGKLLVQLARDKNAGTHECIPESPEANEMLENDLDDKLMELGQLPQVSSSKKVYHYLQTMPRSFFTQSTRNVHKDPYEFEFERSDNLGTSENKITAPRILHHEHTTSNDLGNKGDEELGSNGNHSINLPLLNDYFSPPHAISFDNTSSDSDFVPPSISSGKSSETFTTFKGARIRKEKRWSQDVKVAGSSSPINANIFTRVPIKNLEGSISQQGDNLANDDHIPALHNSNAVLQVNKENSPKKILIEKFLNRTNTTNVKENVDANKVLCTFCFEEVGHFSRHLFRKHSDEEAVKKILMMPLKDNDRRMAIISLRKKGNFLLNQERNELKPVRKPSRCFNKISGDNVKNIDGDEYFTCVSCLGFYKKNYLWRHRKKCTANINQENNSSRIQHLSESQTFLASTGLLGNYLSKSRLKNDVFAIMRADNISKTAKTDPLICLYGESYLNKHKRKQMNVVASNKIREMARLKLALQKSTTCTNLIDVLKPEMYGHIVAAAKIISGFDAETKTFKASSLALNFGTSLKFLCDIAKKAVITKDPIFHELSKTKCNEKRKEIKDLRDMISSHWCNDLSSLANKALNEKKWEKPKLLPITEDVNMFNKYINTVADEAFEKLLNQEDLPLNYKNLVECTLSSVLVFNRKRVGEVQFLDIETYERNFSSLNQEECLSSLSELEKTMSATFKRVVVFGKGSKPVPILFTKKNQRYIEMLLKIRKTTDIVPKSNKYLFANPGSKDRWMSGASVLRKLAHKCGAKNPELLTSTRFRKQIATILQLMSFEKDEMEQIARFMGHTERTHMEFYRLTDDVYQTAKVAKVLLLLNAGKGIHLKGKSLQDIEIAQDVIEDDEPDAENNLDSNEITETRANAEATTDSERREDLEIRTDVEVRTVLKARAVLETRTNSEIRDSDESVIISRPSQSRALKVEEANKTITTKKGNRIRWAAKEKKLVLDFFKKYVQTKTAPKKEECLTLISQHSNIFKESDWVRIKTLVFNTYRNKY